MPQIEINSFFTRDGVPADDIGMGSPPDYPKIRVWQIDNGNRSLVVDESIGIMENIGDGFYGFNFTDTIGYDASKKYLVRIDGGPSLPLGERYQAMAIDPNVPISPSDVQTIAEATADQVWDEQKAEHLTPGSIGLALNQISASNEALVIDVLDVINLVTLLLKYETNRTRIDTQNKTMIVYDDDCTTVLREFKLYDANGNASTDSVTERVPVSANDGLPVCS